MTNKKIKKINEFLEEKNIQTEIENITYACSAMKEKIELNDEKIMKLNEIDKKINEYKQSLIKSEILPLDEKINKLESGVDNFHNIIRNNKILIENILDKKIFLYIKNELENKLDTAFEVVHLETNIIKEEDDYYNTGFKGIEFSTIEKAYYCSLLVPKNKAKFIKNKEKVFTQKSLENTLKNNKIMILCDDYVTIQKDGIASNYENYQPYVSFDSLNLEHIPEKEYEIYKNILWKAIEIALIENYNSAYNNRINNITKENQTYNAANSLNDLEI